MSLSKPEQKFYQYLNSKILAGDVQRIESSTGAGIPDLNVCCHKGEVWIELKVANNGIVLLRKEQYAWGMRRAASHGRVFIMADAQSMIWMWKFPHVSVTPYGTSCKYVKVSDSAIRCFNREAKSWNLIYSFLFIEN